MDSVETELKGMKNRDSTREQGLQNRGQYNRGFSRGYGRFSQRDRGSFYRGRGERGRGWNSNSQNSCTKTGSQSTVVKQGDGLKG